ncbi:MAG: MFS transporter [Methanobacteriota archaeon]|nr:MAG: MFS transporter [Euryarchaeota archaeon]
MPNRSALWNHRDFLNVWAAETISVFGSQFYLIAMPLAAVIILDASAYEMGILFSLEMLPFLLFGLLAGVLADRRRRRTIMIVCDFGRAAVLAVVPVSWYFDALSLPIMYCVAFVAGTFTAFFDIAYQAYLPVLVKRAELLDANSKLETSRASSQVAGPSVAGLAVSAIGAPLAITGNSLSFLGSAVFLLRVKKKELVQRADTYKSVLGEIKEGINVVLSSKTLKGIAGCTATGNLFWGISYAILILFMESTLELSASWIGAVFAVGALGAVAGAVSSSRIVAALGLGKTIILSAFLGGVPSMLIVLAYPSNALLLLMPIWFATGFTGVIYNVNQVSLRQAITPDRLQGKMNATMRFIVWGVYPIGGVIGGLLGEIVGLRMTILIAGIGMLASVTWIALSPVAKVEALPSGCEEADGPKLPEGQSDVVCST